MSAEKKSSGRLPIRSWLRITGPAFVLVGVLFLALSSTDVLSGRQSVRVVESNGEEKTARTVRPAKYQWAFWTGLPLVVVGIVVTSMGFDQLFVSRKGEDDADDPAQRRTMDQPLGQWAAKKGAKRRTDKRDRNA